MKKINAQWHEKNVMPRNATLEKRVKWHLEHIKECGCRPMPKSIAAEIKKRRVH
jgi:hypothetical protein